MIFIFEGKRPDSWKENVSLYRGKQGTKNEFSSNLMNSVEENKPKEHRNAENIATYHCLLTSTIISGFGLKSYKKYKSKLSQDFMFLEIKEKSIFFIFCTIKLMILS